MISTVMTELENITQQKIAGCTWFKFYRQAGVVRGFLSDGYPGVNGMA